MRTVGIVIACLLGGAVGLAACGAVVYMLGVEDIRIEGDTYSVKLVNDTAEPLEFTECVDGAECDPPRFARLVDPGGSYSAGGTVDVVSWFRATDEAGTVVGCFKLDFVDERPPKGTELLASEIGPCP